MGRSVIYACKLRLSAKWRAVANSTTFRNIHDVAVLNLRCDHF